LNSEDSRFGIVVIAEHTSLMSRHFYGSVIRKKCTELTNKFDRVSFVLQQP